MSSCQQILSLMITYEIIKLVWNGALWLQLENQEQMQMHLSKFRILAGFIKHHPETIVQWGIFLIFGTTQWGCLILGAWDELLKRFMIMSALDPPRSHRWHRRNFLKISPVRCGILTWPCRISTWPSLTTWHYLMALSPYRTFEKNPWADRQTIILDWVRWISNGNSDSDLQRLNSKKK